MTTPRGFILRLAQSRHALLSEVAQTYGFFSEPVAAFSQSGNPLLLCLVVSKDDRITHLAPALQGASAGTGLVRLNLRDATPFDPPVEVTRVVDLVPNHLKRWTLDQLRRRGLLSAKVFPAVVKALTQLAPSAALALQRFNGEREQRISRLTVGVQGALASQKTAVLTAMSLAGIRRHTIRDWDPGPSPRPASFLEGLPSVRLHEDAMIVNDLMKLPGHALINPYLSQGVQFESMKCRLTVLLANRLPLEEQTGTDLVYYNETFKSFVMVQYKAMEREGKETLFRIPNAQLTIELERMRRLRSALAAYPGAPGKDCFRLSDNPFFLKLCPRIVLDPDGVDLVHGMYVPLDYWDLLDSDPGVEGEKGGKRITYGNVGRYFDNTEFVAFVSKAWVGTNMNQSAVLGEAIRETVETGKAVAIGIKTDLPRKAPPTEDEDAMPGFGGGDAPEPPDEIGGDALDGSDTGDDGGPAW